MSDNNHLDLSAVRESNEYWFEEIDTSNPFDPDPDCDLCSGDGEQDCESCFGIGEVRPDLTEGDFIVCPDCDGTGRIPCTECDLGDPDDIQDRDFEILWDTAFAIPYLKSGLEFIEAKRLAWAMGWLLFSYDNEYWIAAGSCGYDFTWNKARVALALCDELPIYYAEQLSSGGNVFVSAEQRTKIASAAADAFDRQAKQAQYQAEAMRKIASYGDKVHDIYQYERDLREADRRIAKQATRSTKESK